MSFLGNLWNSIKGFVRLIATGDDGIDNEDIFEKGLQSVGYDGVGSIPEMIGDLRNDLSGATSQNEFNAQEAEKQREFEKMMSDTSYQRAVEDMQKAGLSPTMFYASGGSGASTPSGASGRSGSGQAMDVLGSIGSIMNSINTARELDWRTGRDQMPNRKTSEAYNDLSSIIHTVSKSIGFDG